MLEPSSRVVARASYKMIDVDVTDTDVVVEHVDATAVGSSAGAASCCVDVEATVDRDGPTREDSIALDATPDDHVDDGGIKVADVAPV
jgi:hypothetical protein